MTIDKEKSHCILKSFSEIINVQSYVLQYYLTFTSGEVHLGFFELFEKYIIGNMITTKSTSFYTPHNFRVYAKVTKRSKCFQICHIFVIRKPQFHFEVHVLLWVLLFHKIFVNVKLFIWSRKINPENSMCDIVLSMYFTHSHFFFINLNFPCTSNVLFYFWI